MSNTYSVELDQQPIELYKLLKITNLVAGGGEAKIVISEGYVHVNGELALQKRKKIYHGDLIAFNGDFIEVYVNENARQTSQTPATTPVKEKNKPANKKNKSSPKKSLQQGITKLGKRKPINF